MYNYKCWLVNLSTYQVCEIITQLLKDSGFSVLNFIDHQFEPEGYTCLWLLAESHAAIHSFPEESKIYVEVSSCNSHYLGKFREFLEYEFNANII
jgi:S-adenosylmethionine decarboxylase